MAEQLLRVDRSTKLCVQTFGDPAHPAVLLISGATGSMDWWDVEFCQLLVARGRFVIRYDHRDTGRSTSSPAGKPSYTGADLVTDPLRVLDALGVERAHLVGVSMGGGIAQELAAWHPERLLTITLIATSPSGERADRTELPPPEPRVLATFDDPDPEPAWDDRKAVIDYLVESHRPFAGSLGLDEPWLRRIAGIVVDRTRDVAASVTNHWVVEDGGSPPYGLAELTVPTLVLHGTADPFFPLAHGRALAAEIPGATLVPLEGMGHEVPPPKLWDVVVSAIDRHTARE